jgi:hypothetical protein
MSIGRVLAQVPARLLVGAIGAYRYALSPLLGTNCRFEPSCACYGQEAVRRHGAIGGAWLALRRILRCHPWGGMGYDPVPDAAPAVTPGHITGPSR